VKKVSRGDRFHFFGGPAIQTKTGIKHRHPHLQTNTPSLPPSLPPSPPPSFLPEVGSSRNSKEGLQMSSTPTDTRFRSPPLTPLTRASP